VVARGIGALGTDKIADSKKSKNLKTCLKLSPKLFTVAKQEA
jgi:hypothetical protein